MGSTPHYQHTPRNKDNNKCIMPYLCFLSPLLPLSPLPVSLFPPLVFYFRLPLTAPLFLFFVVFFLPRRSAFFLGPTRDHTINLSNKHKQHTNTDEQHQQAHHTIPDECEWSVVHPVVTLCVVFVSAWWLERFEMG